MVKKILKAGYCNLMMAYYVEYIDDVTGTKRSYFDNTEERNKFIADNQ